MPSGLISDWKCPPNPLDCLASIFRISALDTQRSGQTLTNIRKPCLPSLACQPSYYWWFATSFFVQPLLVYVGVATQLVLICSWIKGYLWICALQKRSTKLTKAARSWNSNNDGFWDLFNKVMNTVAPQYPRSALSIIMERSSTLGSNKNHCTCLCHSKDGEIPWCSVFSAPSLGNPCWSPPFWTHPSKHSTTKSAADHSSVPANCRFNFLSWVVSQPFDKGLV